MYFVFYLLVLNVMFNVCLFIFFVVNILKSCFECFLWLIVGVLYRDVMERDM